MGPPDGALRRLALAVSVLDDVDLVVTATGVRLPGPPPVLVAWRRIRHALGPAAPDSDLARSRLTDWLRAARCAIGRTPSDLAARARPIGFPVDAALHPGLDWVRERVLGGALDLGLGLAGLDPRAPDEVVAVPAEVLELLRADADPWWPGARRYLEDMGAIAADRWWREPQAPLRPMGDCDVVTLLGSARLRATLAASGGGMRTCAVPMRDRGWLDLQRLDPAFALAAAAATPLARRGFARPLLVTADEVAMARAGGDPAELVLRDPAPAGHERWRRPVRYSR